MDRKHDSAGAGLDQSDNLSPEVLQGIVGGAGVLTRRTPEGQDVPLVGDQLEVAKNFRDNLADHDGRPLPAEAEKYTKTTLTKQIFKADSKIETLKISSALDNEKALSKSALKDATANHAKASDRVAETAQTLKIVTDHKASQMQVDAATKAHEAAKTSEAKAARDVEAAKAKQEEHDAADKKAKAEKDASKPKGAGAKVADLATKHLDKAVKYGGKGLDILAEKDAKARGTLHEDSYTRVHSGGSSSEVRDDGNVKVEKKTFAHTLTEGSEKSYSSHIGDGSKASWTARAEAGTETKTTTKLSNDVTTTETNKAYAGVAWENKAGYTINGTGITAEASSKVVGHAEASHSFSIKTGDVTTTDTFTALVHGEAGVKVGGHIGLDGVKLQAKASAEIIAKVEHKHEVDYGDLKVKSTTSVYAAAKAEAKAEVDARLDFTKGVVKAKGGLGAEASAGVGAEGMAGAHSASGNGADVGGGLYAGKVGAKLEADFDVKDGKLSLDLEVGASIGLGATGKVSIKGDLNEAKKGILDTTNVIAEAPIALKPLTIVTGLNIALVKGIAGFFS